MSGKRFGTAGLIAALVAGLAVSLGSGCGSGGDGADRSPSADASPGAGTPSATFAPDATPTPIPGGAPPLTGRLAFVSFRDGAQEVYAMNADGSGQTNLTRNPADDFDPDWSPDGNSILFVSKRDGAPEVYIMDADGGRVRRVTYSSNGELSPKWSPDGKRIAYSLDGSLAVMNADGGEVRTLMEAQAESTAEPCHAGGYPGGWSPDGKSILYYSASVSRGISWLCTVGVDDSKVTVLLDAPETFAAEPVFSPDGKKVAYRRIREGNHEIMVLDLRTGEEVDLTNDPATDLEPAWSSDGNWIAFGSMRGDSPHFDIYVMRPDGSNLRRLTDDPDKDSYPVWRP